MRLVIDTSILIAALIKDSIMRQIISHFDGELLTISFSDAEIGKYKEYILKKSGMAETEFYHVLEKIVSNLVFIDDSIVFKKIDEGIKIMENIDIKDAPFIAAAMATNSYIWSDDEHFQKQNKVRILKTKDVMKLFNK